MCTSSGFKRKVAGLTLLEVIFVIVVLGVLTKVAMMKLVTPATMTLHTQAQSVADLIRRGQSLAVVRGQRHSVAVATAGANRSIAAACPASGGCSTDASFSVSQEVALGPVSTLYFNSLGQPVDNAGTVLSTNSVFTVSYEGTSFNVSVAPLTGRVSVTP